MPLLDHFHPPLRGPRRWEGFLLAWAANIAQQLNRQELPADFFAEPEVSLGPTLELDVWEVRVYEGLEGPQLRAGIELVSPVNKDEPRSRQTLAAKCAGYLKQAVSVILVDVVTERTANWHADILGNLEISGASWESSTQLSAVSYQPVPVRDQRHIKAWQEVLSLGTALPVLPLWFRLDLSVSLQLEETYAATCSGLRIPVG
jgi:hypothetical protein